MQSLIDALKTFGVSLRYAERKIHLKLGAETDGTPMPVNILYVIAFPLGKEPGQFATPKSSGMHL